jgi:hypothetical protein
LTQGNLSINLSTLSVDETVVFENFTANQAYSLNQTLIVSRGITQYFYANCQGYDPEFKELYLNVIKVVGSGSGTTWSINLSGEIGPTGPTGPKGATGDTPTWTNTAAGLAGGIAVGITFEVGLTSLQVLEQLIYPYQPVTFTAFAVNVGSSPFFLGQTLAAGSYNATWSTGGGPVTNWVAGSIVISNNTTSTRLREGLNYNSSPAGVTHPAYRYTTPTTIQFGITGEQVKAVSGTTRVSRTENYSWLHRVYSGKSSSSSLSSISDLTTGLAVRPTSSTTALGAVTYSFPTSGTAQYCYVVTPTSPGSPGTYTSWKDPNNLSFTPISGTFNELNSHGVTISWTWYQVSNPTTSNFSVGAS